MHALGLGLVTWCGTVVVLAILLLSTYRGRLDRFRSLRPTLLQAFAVLCLLGIAQMLFMALLMGPPRPHLAPTAPFDPRRGLGLIAIYPVIVAMNFFGILPASFDGIEYEIKAAAIVPAAGCPAITIRGGAVHRFGGDGIFRARSFSRRSATARPGE
jgi:hypothetical protein